MLASRRIMAALVCSALALAGCTRERLVIANETGQALKCEVRLPRHSYSISMTPHHDFRFDLPAGATWDSARAPRSDRVIVHQPVGMTIVRAKPRSLDAEARSWAVGDEAGAPRRERQNVRLRLRDTGLYLEQQSPDGSFKEVEPRDSDEESTPPG